MHKFFWPAVFGLLAWIGAGTYFLQCEDCNPKKAEAQVMPDLPPPVEAKPNVWTVSDGSRFSAGSFEHYTFGRNGFVPNLTDPTKASFNKVADHLKSNSGRQLQLTGYYTADEQAAYLTDASKAHANLGIHRAAAIKDYLVNNGAPAGNITLAGFEQNNLSFNSNDRLPEGVRFRFGGNEDLVALAASLKAKPLNVRFASGSDNIAMNDELIQYFADLKFYTDRKNDAQVTVTGHTDSDGARAGNVRLGKRRANLIKDYMIRQGINESVITEVSSLGPDQPIADNNTPEGKAQNRRVEIRVIN